MTKWALSGVVLVLAAIAWLTDWVTPEGVWTIYTVRCDRAWHGASCDGRTRVGPRYRFRAMPAEGTVLMEQADEGAQRRTLAGCVVQNRSNWRCTELEGQAFPTPMVMSDGELLIGSVPAHQVSKWRWLLLRLRG